MNVHLERASGCSWASIWKKETSSGGTALSFSHWYVTTRDALAPGPLRFDSLTGILSVDEFGAFLTLRNGQPIIQCHDEQFVFGPKCKVTAIHLSRPASLSSPAICALTERGIGLAIWQRRGAALRSLNTFFEYDALGDTRPAAVETRLRIYWAACDKHKSLKIARAVVVGKLKRHNAERVFMDRAKAASSLRKLMIVEAQGTKSFWRNLGVVRARGHDTGDIGAVVRQRGRVRKSMTSRHAKDPVNGAINYTNAVAAGRILQELVSMGADPAVGFLHRRGLALVYECLELVRAEIAVAVVEYVNRRPDLSRSTGMLSAMARRDLSRIATACDVHDAVRRVLAFVFKC